MSKSDPQDAKETPGTSRVLAENIELLVAEHRRERESESRTRIIVGRIAGFVGSIHFLYVHLIFFGLWIISNRCETPLPRFDPDLHFLTIFAALESLFLSACVVINQNRMQAIADEHSHLQLHISLLAEREATRLIRLVARLAEKAGVESGEDDDLADLMQDVTPKEVLQEIKKSEGS